MNILGGLTLGAVNPELLEHETGQTGSGIQRSQAEGGVGQNQQGVQDLEDALVAAGNLGSHTGNAARKDVGGTGSVAGLAGVSDGNQGDDSQNALQQHAAVSDGLCIGFLVQLLGGGAGGNQRMEAGDGAAGDGGEQDGEDGLGDAGSILAVTDHGQANTGGIGHVGMGNDDAQGSDGQHGVQQEGGQIVTGLQQDPHGGNGRDGNVQTNDPHPGGVGQVDGMPVHTDDHAQADGSHTGNGGNAHGRVAAVNHKAEGDGDYDEQQGNHCHGSGGSGSGHIQLTIHILGCEGTGNDGRESGNDQDQGQVREDDEQALCPQGHIGGDDFADGLAAVTDGGKQGTEVMDAAEEDAADQDPQNAGQPAEHSSGDGAGNGTGAGDGGEMMAHQNRGLCGDVVNAVLHGVCGGGIGVFTYAPLLAQVAAIEDIAAEQNGNADQQKYETVHRFSLLPSFPFSRNQNSVPGFSVLPVLLG